MPHWPLSLRRVCSRFEASMLGTVLMGVSLSLGTGCEQSAPPPVYVIRVTALDRDERPLAGVSVSLNKQPTGLTGPDGVLTLQQQGVEGARLNGHIDCPVGLISDAPDFTVTLSQVRGLGSKEMAPLVQTVSCRPIQQEGVIVVKSGQSGLPVVVDGTPTMYTDALGLAYVYVQRKPDGHVEVQLDTSANPKLIPQNPSRRFQFKGDDEIFEFEQPIVLEKEKPKKVVKRKAPPPPPPKHIPQRL
jgi:hypothetical protein